MRLILFLLFIFLVAATAFADPVILAGNSKKSVSTGFTYLFDSSGSLTLEKIVPAYAANKFSTPEVQPLKSAYGVYWLHFSLQNNTGFDGEWILDFQNWSLIDAYVGSNKQYEVKKTGHLFPYNKRDYKVANKAYVLVLIKNSETRDFFVRVESKYNNELKPVNLNFDVIPRAMADGENKKTGNAIYAFLAVMLIMLIYNLFIYFSTRLRSYAIYLVVIFFAFYHTSYNSGYLVEIFRNIDSFPILLTYFEKLSSSLFGVSIILFASEFLKIKKRYPGWYKVIQIILTSYLVFGVVLLINEDIGTLASSLSGLATILTIIILAIKSTRDRYPSAVYFLIGFSFFLLGVFTIILSVLGVLPENVWTLSFALPLGTTIEIIFFSFALGNMINVLRKDNEEKQQRIIQQLEENHLLQTKVNRELEEKVLERTAEINRQKEQISLQKEKIEIERQKSENLLLNILPELTANELKEKGYATPKLYENVTILFTDFVGFTAISEKLEAKKLVEDLDYCFSKFDEIMTGNSLEKIKTIGDSYMAICGAPVAEANHALNSVKAALDIRLFIENWNIEKRRGSQPPWEIRIGLHSGSVIAGVVGKKKFAFDIWSDAVNTASKMESCGEGGMINISGDTYELIKNHFRCRHRGKIKAKNKGEIDMYFILDD